MIDQFVYMKKKSNKNSLTFQLARIDTLRAYKLIFIDTSPFDAHINTTTNWSRSLLFESDFENDPIDL